MTLQKRFRKGEMEHMRLHVEGTQLKDVNGEIVQLKGVSSHGLQWYPEYINKDALQTLHDDWKANVFRMAMYTAEGGFLDGADQKKQYDLDQSLHGKVFLQF